MSEANEKSSKFMNWFWDLASDDDNRRCIAATMIVKYIAETQKRVDTPCTMSVDCDYTLKRLIRGLSSSRDSARQGFSACLCQFLKVFPFVELAQVMEILDDTTKNSGAMRGSEERDVMFGRLFGYLALIRSGRLRQDSTSALQALERLIGLYKRKVWIREVVSEAILFLLEEMPTDVETLTAAGRRLGEIVEGSTDIGDISADQLVLVSGLQNFCQSKNDSSTEAIRRVISACCSSQLLTADRLPELADTLLTACSGFPKVHRAWTSILIAIFGSADFRCLPKERVHILGGGEEALLSALVAFIESKLIPVGGSHERKGVALKLTLELVRLVPTTLIPVVLSQRVVQCLVSIRGNPKHTLFDLAGATLQEIVRGAGDSSIGDSGAAMCRLAIANAFVLHGSAVFDNRTATSTVGELLQALTMPLVLQHVTSLCGMIASTVKKPATDTGKEDDEDEDVGEGSVTSAVAAVNALYALAKNSRIANRGSVCSVVMAVFIRLACFGPGSTVPVEAESRGTKKPKKKSKAKDIQSIFTEWHIDSDLADKIVATVHHIEKNPDMSSYLETTASGESVAATAGSRLLALLADMGHMSVLQLNEESAENVQEGVSGTPGVSLLHVATATLLHIACSIRLRVDFAGENVEGSAGGGYVQELRLALMALQSLVDSPGVPSRLVSSLDAMLCQSAFHVYISDNVDAECLGVLCRVIPAIVSGTSEQHQAKAPVVDDDEDEDESLQSELFGACMDLLAVPGDHAVKGVRDAIKRAWGSIMQHCAPDSEVAEAILLAVIGDDVMEIEEGDVERLRDVDEEEGDGSEEDDEEEAEGDVDDDDDDHDIMLNHDDMMHMLHNDSGGDDLSEDGEGLTHHEGADAALAQLIQMKKQNRKKGLMMAKRQELIIRSRAIDILEMFLHRNENALLVLPMFKPLLFCLKKVSASSLCRGLQEGRAFQNRLKSLIDTKLSKTKMVYEKRPDNEDENDEIAFIAALAGDTVTYIGQILRAADAALRQVGIACYVCVARSIIAGHIEGSEVLQANFNACVSEYFNKKNSRVPVKLIDDMVTRYPDFVVYSALEAVISAATEEAKSNFLLAESFRVLTNVLKRFPSLTADSKAAIVAAIPLLVGCVVNVISSDVTTDAKAKRVKPILIFAKDLIQFLKTQLRADGTDSLQNVAQAVLELKATFSVDDGPSHMKTAAAGSGVQKLFGQACSAADGLESIDVKSTGRKKRGGRETANSATVNESRNSHDSKTKSKKQRRRKSFDDEFGESEADVDYEKELVILSRQSAPATEATQAAAVPEKPKKSKKQKK